MNKTLITLFCIGLTLAAISYILPEDKPTDAELCAPYPPKERGISNILYCKCSDKINQEPGKCEDKYK